MLVFHSVLARNLTAHFATHLFVLTVEGSPVHTSLTTLIYLTSLKPNHFTITTISIST